MQNRRRRERAAALFGQRTEQERADSEREDHGHGTDARAPERIDDVPAAAEHRSHARAEAIGERRRLPGDERRLALVPRLDQALPVCGDRQRRAALDDVVVEVAGARQPDAAVQDFEAPAAAAEWQDGAAAQGLKALRGRDQTAPDVLRMHHESPWLTVPL